MQLTPLADRVVVKAVKEDDVTKSGIVLPDSSKDKKPERGEVIAVGAGKLLDNGQRAPMDVKAGDQVLFTQYGPDEVKVDGEDLLVIKQDDILAVISK